MDPETTVDSGSAQPAPVSVNPGVLTAPGQGPAQQAQQALQDQAAAPTVQPTIVTPKKRGGLAGIVDEFRDAVAGPAPGKIYTDADGNEFIKHPDSNGNKWARIIATGLRGAAAGAAVGQGPAGAWKAGEAGIQAGDKIAAQRQQQAKNQSEEVKQANLEKFNAVKLKHDAAAQEFQLQRLKIKGTQEDIDFAQKQIDREHTLGSADLGVYKDEADLARVKDAHPDFWKSVYANNVIAVPELNDKGERQGIHVFLRTPGIGSQPVEAGTPIKIFTPGKNADDPPTLTEQVPTIPMTHDMVDAYNNAALTKYQKWQADKGEAELKAAQAKEAEGKASEAPSEIEKNKAEARKANAEAKAMSQLGVPISPNFTKDQGSFYKSEEDLRAALATQNQQVPPDFATLYAIGHYDAKLESNYSPRPYNRPGAPTQRSASDATTAIRTFINPDFDQKNYNAVQKMQDEYASSKPNTAGGNVIAFNTASRHVGMAYDAAVALKNNDYPAVNSIVNRWNQATGGKVKPNFDSIKAALVGELGKTFKGAAVDIPERESLEKTIDSSMSPDQLINSGVLQTYAKLMKSKTDVLDSFYYSNSGRHPKGLIDPETQNVYQKLGVGDGVGGGPSAGKFSVSRWQAANPGKDANAATAAAKQQKLEVVP